jgi:hypothetical protein
MTIALLRIISLAKHWTACQVMWQNSSSDSHVVLPRHGDASAETQFVTLFERIHPPHWCVANEAEKLCDMWVYTKHAADYKQNVGHLTLRLVGGYVEKCCQP